jgi:hypothetical protein
LILLRSPKIPVNDHHQYDVDEPAPDVREMLDRDPFNCRDKTTGEPQSLILYFEDGTSSSDHPVRTWEPDPPETVAETQMSFIGPKQ